MNEAVAPRIYGLPRVEETSTLDEQKPTWLQLRLYEAYITNMAATTTPPRTPVNWTVITGLCAVATFILVLLTMVCAATWYISAQSQHIQDMELQGKKDKEVLEQRISKAEQDAAEAKKFQVYNTGAKDEKDGHAKESKK